MGKLLCKEFREGEACRMDISSEGIILPNDISYFTGPCAFFISAFSLRLEYRGGGRSEYRVCGVEYHGSKFKRFPFILQPSFYILTVVSCSNRCVLAKQTPDKGPKSWQAAPAKNFGIHPTKTPESQHTNN